MHICVEQNRWKWRSIVKAFTMLTICSDHINARISKIHLLSWFWFCCFFFPFFGVFHSYFGYSSHSSLVGVLRAQCLFNTKAINARTTSNMLTSTFFHMNWAVILTLLLFYPIEILSNTKHKYDDTHTLLYCNWILKALFSV